MTRYPWLMAEVPDLPEDWAQALDEAMAEIARLHLPPQFRLIRVFEDIGSLRVEWRNAGAAEDDVGRIALKLAIRTDTWSVDPSDPTF